MKTAIITGASRGIGRELAIMLADNYDRIAIASFKNKDKLLEVADIINNKGCKCLAMQGDCGDYTFAGEFIARTADFFDGQIDLLINNAGISYVGLLSDMSYEEFDNITKTNYYSVFNMCRQSLPYMINNKSGRILNVSSVWGNVGASCEVAYSAAKGAINTFTKALAKELAPSNIIVNAIAFGAIDTEMNSHLSEEERQMLIDEIPSCRFASPREAAEFAMQLCNVSSYLTGQVISFDGAWQ